MMNRRGLAGVSTKRFSYATVSALGCHCGYQTKPPLSKVRLYVVVRDPDPKPNGPKAQAVGEMIQALSRPQLALVGSQRIIVCWLPDRLEARLLA